MGHNTQHSHILAYIDMFGKITPMDAFADLGITKLATRISELKKLGYEFEQELTYRTNRFGKPCHFMTYTLKNKPEEIK